MKLVSQPVAQNKLLLRLENLADAYDGQSLATVDLNQVAKALWTSANFNKPVPMGSVTFSEMNLFRFLSANMLLSEMEARRVHWSTVDDLTRDLPTDFKPRSIDLDPSSVLALQVQLKEQAIRVFISFHNFNTLKQQITYPKALSN